MRFVVPVPTIYARPNRKFFGPERGVTWLSMINDQAAGLGATVVSGTPRDSLHMIDVLYAHDGGQRPDIVITDSGSYSDLVFGLVHLLGMSYRPHRVGMEEQLGALGLVLNCIVLLNTFYMNAALEQLRAGGYPVGGGGLARLSPFVRHHLGARPLLVRAA
jgi:TnpA family transposase